MARQTTYEERYRIWELSVKKYKDREISDKMKLSISTVRKWRRLINETGNEFLVSRMGRPKKGALSSYSEGLQRLLYNERRDYPGRGAKTLRAQFFEWGWPADDIPSESSIHRYLKQKDFPKDYRPRNEPGAIECKKPSAVHEEWEMDAKGRDPVADIGVISLININDRYSHGRLLSFPCYLGKKRAVRYPQTEDYQTALRLAFNDWGLPDRIGVDHDTIFYDDDRYPTRFHLWLIGLGVNLCFGRKGVAADQGMTERSHQLWNNQVILGQRFQDLEQLYLALQKRRDFLNSWLPCSTLDNKPIREVFPELSIPRRVYKVHLEAEIFQVERIYTYLSEGRWFRKVAENGTVALGAQIYGVGVAWAKRQIEITFDADRKQLRMFNPEKDEVKYHNLKGCSKETLMGELPIWKNLKGLQLCLPFSYNDWKVSRLYDSQR